MGEDQDAAGARRLDEAQRGDRLAGAGGVLEPEALGRRWGPRAARRSWASSSSSRLVLPVRGSSSGRRPPRRLVLLARDRRRGQLRRLDGRRHRAVAVAVALRLGEQRGQRSRQRVDLVGGQHGAVGEVRLVLATAGARARAAARTCAATPWTAPGARRRARPARRRARAGAAAPGGRASSGDSPSCTKGSRVNTSARAMAAGLGNGRDRKGHWGGVSHREAQEPRQTAARLRSGFGAARDGEVRPSDAMPPRRLRLEDSDVAEADSDLGRRQVRERFCSDLPACVRQARCVVGSRPLARRPGRARRSCSSGYAVAGCRELGGGQPRSAAAAPTSRAPRRSGLAGRRWRRCTRRPTSSSAAARGRSSRGSRARGATRSSCNKWASWCGPCQSRVPGLPAARGRVGTQVAFVGVNGKRPRAATPRRSCSGSRSPTRATTIPNEEIARSIRARVLPDHRLLRPPGADRVRARGPLLSAERARTRTSGATHSADDRHVVRGRRVEASARWRPRSSCATRCSASSRASRARGARRPRRRGDPSRRIVGRRAGRDLPAAAGRRRPSSSAGSRCAHPARRRGDRAALLELADERGARRGASAALVLHAQTYAHELYARPATDRGAGRSSRRASSTSRWRSALERACQRSASTRSPGTGRSSPGERADAAGRRADARRRAPVDRPRADPFAEGHEDRTPPEVYACARGAGRRTRPAGRCGSVPNLYPALEPPRRGGRDPEPRRREPPTCSARRAGARRARGDRQRARSRSSRWPSSTVEQVAAAMEVWRERMRAHAERRVRAPDRQRAPRGGRLAAAHARAALRARLRAGGDRARARARSAPTRPARWAATCSPTSSRRRSAGASGSSRSTTRPC